MHGGTGPEQSCGTAENFDNGRSRERLPRRTELFNLQARGYR